MTERQMSGKNRPQRRRTSGKDWKKRNRRRRLRRKIKAWTARVIVLAVLVLTLLLTLKGALALWNKMSVLWQPEAAFSGAAFVGESGDTPGVLLVAVDAGHGGRDQGTCAGDVLEKDINLKVAGKLAEKLEDSGVSVLMTRTKDEKVGLEERAEAANEKKADMFVSIHCNYYEDSTEIRGMECYYREGSAGGEQLANCISEKAGEEGAITNRGVRTADYRVLRKTDMTAVLVELGYLSNPEECRKLMEKDYQELLAEKIAEGIRKAAELEEAVAAQ